MKTTDINIIKRAAEILEENDLSLLHITYRDMKIELERKVSAPVEFAKIGKKEPVLAEKTQKKPANYIEVKSPLTGVFYSAPRPGADPYANVGDKVTVGQTLCLVEAMKMFNEITSETNGTIAEIVAENAEVVQSGQVMFYIVP